MAVFLSQWRIFSDTKDADAAERFTAKLQKRVDHTFREIVVDHYHKGGHLVTFTIEHEFDDWIATVYDVIAFAQRMGYGWSISGFIDEELDLIATDLSIAGIKLVTCHCARTGTLNARSRGHAPE